MYPSYINSKKTIVEGRRIAKEKVNCIINDYMLICEGTNICAVTALHDFILVFMTWLY